MLNQDKNNTMNKTNVTIAKNCIVLLFSLITLFSCENEGAYVAVTSVSLNTTHISLIGGEKYELKATISPHSATNKNLIWITSDASIADVIDGMVLAGKSGEAIITVQTDDGAKTATCSVAVTGGNDDTTDAGNDPGTPGQPDDSNKPDKPETKSHEYFIMDGCGNVALPNREYKHWYFQAAVKSGNEYIGCAENVFTFTEVDGGYTIQDADGYYYMDDGLFSTSKSIPSDNKRHIWTITHQTDGTSAIRNAVTADVIQLYPVGYNSCYAYSDDDTSILPYLVKADKVSEDHADNAMNYKYDPTDLSYTIDGKSYKMIYVEGDGNIKPFYIMQTEIPPKSSFQIGSDQIGVLDANDDNIVTCNELADLIAQIWLKTRIPVRLPNYKEWLYAAKGGKKSKNYKYSGSNSIDEVAWYSGNSGSMGHDVAQKVPNELGLYDMSGNYEEACGWFDVHNVGETGLGDVIMQLNGDLYGGRWNDQPSNCTTSSRRDGYHSNFDREWNNCVNARYITIRLVYSLE